MNKEQIVKYVKENWRGFIRGCIIGLIVGYLAMRLIFN